MILRTARCISCDYWCTAGKCRELHGECVDCGARLILDGEITKEFDMRPIMQRAAAKPEWQWHWLLIGPALMVIVTLVAVFFRS